MSADEKDMIGRLAERLDMTRVDAVLELVREACRAVGVPQAPANPPRGWTPRTRRRDSLSADDSSAIRLSPADQTLRKTLLAYESESDD